MKKKKMLSRIIKTALMLPIMPIVGIPGGGDVSSGNETNETTTGTNTGTNAFDDFLKNKDMQAEFDRRIAKGINTAKEKWDADAQTKIAEAVEQAQKLAKMNADQKAQYEREQTEKKLAEREANISKRELQSEAKDILREKGLPAELFSVLDYGNAEMCSASIDALEKAFRSAVENAVDERIRQSGTTLKTGGNNTVRSSVENKFYELNPKLKR